MDKAKVIEDLFNKLDLNNDRLEKSGKNIRIGLDDIRETLIVETFLANLIKIDQKPEYTI
jgi:hypothetical protein